MSVNIPDCPPSLKSIQHFLKIAAEHDARDPTVAYWCRLHALQTGLKLTTKKTPEETKVLMGKVLATQFLVRTQFPNIFYCMPNNLFSTYLLLHLL